MIVSRDQVRAAVDRALTLDPAGCFETAVVVAAQGLGLTVEAVREALEPVADGVTQ